MGNVHMEATQVNYREGNKKMSVAEAIKNAGSEITPEEKTWIDSIPNLTTSNAGKTDQTVIAPEFDAEAGTYEIGDQVMYEGKLYKFTSAHETPGDWDSSEVSETTVADDLSSLESGLTNLKDVLSGMKFGGISGQSVQAGASTTVSFSTAANFYPDHAIFIPTGMRWCTPDEITVTISDGVLTASMKLFGLVDTAQAAVNGYFIYWDD